MKNIAICASNDNTNTDIYTTIDTIKKNGFKNVFIQWYDKDFEVPQEKQLEYIRKQGLNVVFAHLGYQKINTIWEEGETGETHIKRFKDDILTCHNNGINLVIMHPQSKWEAPGPNEIGLRRFREICEYAKSLGVKVAIENTRLFPHLKYLLDNIKLDNVGLCVDVGHWHCNFKDEHDIKEFKDRIFAVHLHDNDGNDDQHLIPFEGNADWKRYLSDLKAANFNSYLTFEQCTIHYLKTPDLDEFYKKSYETGVKIAQMYDEL